MGNDRCCVGPCDNDRRYPDRQVKRKYVNTLRWHRFPVDEKRKNAWEVLISKGRANFKAGKETKVCSNHFIDGEPTIENPDPTLFLTIQDYKDYEKKPQTPRRKQPAKRVAPVCGGRSAIPSKIPGSHHSDEDLKCESTCHVPMSFEQLTRECDVRFYTGFHSSETFKTIFNHVAPKAYVMQYWEGQKKASCYAPKSGYSNRIQTILASEMFSELDPPPLNRRGPPRKLSLEQEFLMTMMRLRLGIMHEDLAWRFSVSSSRVSQVIITWIKLLSKEMSCLIVWPSKEQVHATLPDSFKRFFPKTRVIIDCTEIFVETPSSLEIQALLWSDYKHHCTFKVLICITPNGAVSWVSPAYGGRASDKHIVRDSGFLELLEPHDCIMADRGFKIRDDLVMKRCTLAIPPSAAKGNQLTEKDDCETKHIANVRIYVEQAIKRIKDFNILNITLPLTELHLSFDDYVIICSAFVNLLNPLCK